jgi:hypothetical protein
MKIRILKFFWGAILFFLVGLTIATSSGYVTFDYLTGQTSLVIFIGLALASFISYFVISFKNWAWLFPTFIFSALALNAAGVFEVYSTPIVAFPILLAIAIPFYIAFLLDHKQWVWLIPAWILTIIAIIPPLSERLNPDLLAGLVLYSLSLPFLVGCIVSPRCRWSLLMAAFLGFIGVFSLVETLIHGDILGPVIMLLLALPFFLTYYVSKKNWWALLPSGIFTTIVMVALLDRFVPAYDYITIGNYQLGIYSSLLFLGLAVTFATVRRLHPYQTTEWSRYPTIGFLAASVLALVMGESFLTLLPLVALLIIGIVTLSIALKMRVTQQPSS